MPRRGAWVLAIGLGLLLRATGLSAQVADLGPRRPDRFPATTPLQPDSTTEPVGPARAFFMSAVVPGAGQRALGLERWAVYIAVEAWGWLSYVQHHHQGRVLERQYRDLAWNVARRISVGPRQDGPWPYYEAMEHYQASGSLDTNPEQAGVQPETKLDTYNGQVWQLAQELYMPPASTPYSPTSSQYQTALAYYLKNAITPQFAWSWGDDLLEQNLYSSVIHRSDQAYRHAKTLLGLILANHIVSAVDALVVERLRATGAREIRLQSAPAGADGRWTISVSIPLTVR